ncbi:MAG: acetylglutamate kinase [Clostridiales bacterium]|nr:acetylglutamate kinase [Clostridiales bacterium]
MMANNAQRAEILVQALPYIQQYTGRVVVIKYGGNAMINEELKHAVMRDIVLLSLVGVKVVLIHGGGPEITDMLKKIGKPSSFVDGLRVTDRETADVVQMVLSGKINKGLVNLLSSIGGKAIGLCGMDGRMIEARPLREELGFVGEIVRTNVEPILDVLEKGYIPVVSTVGCDMDGNTYNINADTAAARIAGELGAVCLVSMTDIAGILRDRNDPSSLIVHIDMTEVPQLIESGVIAGGMIPKAECCMEAIRRGVKKVFIIDGRVPHSVLIELLTDEGIGTMFEG